MYIYVLLLANSVWFVKQNMAFCTCADTDKLLDTGRLFGVLFNLLQVLSISYSFVCWFFLIRIHSIKKLIVQFFFFGGGGMFRGRGKNYVYNCLAYL